AHANTQPIYKVIDDEAREIWALTKSTLIQRVAHYVARPANTGSILVSTAGEPQQRFVVRSDGRLEWGDGSSTADTFLRRFQAEMLATDGHLRVVKNLYLN